MKNKFIKSTLILMVGGFFTKILGMIIRIVMTRLLGSEGIGLYMLIMPTFNLFIALSQLGLPTALSKLIAEEKHNNKNLILTSILFSLFVNGGILFFLIVGSKYISFHLLHDIRCFYGLLSIGFVLPFISISNMIRSYFFGKEKMFPHVLSNVAEDIVRLLTLLFGIPLFLVKGIEWAIAFVVLSNILSELTSTFILYFFLPKFTLQKEDFKIQKKNVKALFEIAFPTLTTRVIGNIGGFLEPVLLTYVLLKIGYTNHFIVNEYGVLNGYVMPLILLPSFFTMAISHALLPVISNHYSNRNFYSTKRKIHQALFVSLLIGIPVTFVLTFFPEIPLKWIYNTSVGISYIRFLAPICLLHYIQGPLTACMQGMDMAKCAMRGSITGMFLRTIALFCLSFLKIGMWGLIFASSINIFYVTFHHIYHVRRNLKKH